MLEITGYREPLWETLCREGGVKDDREELETKHSFINEVALPRSQANQPVKFRSLEFIVFANEFQTGYLYLIFRGPSSRKKTSVKAPNILPS